MKVTASDATAVRTTHAPADVPPHTGLSSSGPPPRSANFSVMLAEFLVAMQALRKVIKDGEARGLSAQWVIQKSSIDKQREYIKKTYECALLTGGLEMVTGVAAGGMAIFGFKSSTFGGGAMGMEVGSQLGSNVVGPIVNNASRMIGGGMTQEASEAQLSADFSRNSSETHGRLVSTLSEDAAAIQHEYLSTTKSLATAMLDVFKTVDIGK